MTLRSNPHVNLWTRGQTTPWFCVQQRNSVQTSVFTPLTQYFIRAGPFVLFSIYSPFMDILSFLSADLLSLTGGSNHYWTFPFRVVLKPLQHHWMLTYIQTWVPEYLPVAFTNTGLTIVSELWRQFFDPQDFSTRGPFRCFSFDICLHDQHLTADKWAFNTFEKVKIPIFTVLFYWYRVKIYIFFLHFYYRLKHNKYEMV